jgi:haloacetate dehalogenase
MTLLPGTRRVALDVFGATIVVHRADPERARRTTPTLLLHGLPETAVHFRHLLPELSTDRIVLAPDLKGLGDSRGGRPYDPVTIAHEMAAVVRQEVGGRAVDVVGHDFGGLVAQALAAERADLVRRLVLISSPYRGAEPFRLLRVPLVALPAMPELLARRQVALPVKELVGSGWRTGELEPEVLAHYEQAYSGGAKVTALLGYYQDLVLPRLSRLARLVVQRRPLPDEPPPLQTARILVVHGGADPVLPLAGARAAAEHIGPRARLVEVPAAGHWPLEEAPAQTVPLVTGFLRERAG